MEAERRAPVSTFLAVTLAEGTGAPEESVMKPEMLAETWARTTGTWKRIRRKAGTTIRKKMREKREGSMVHPWAVAKVFDRRRRVPAAEQFNMSRIVMSNRLNSNRNEATLGGFAGGESYKAADAIPMEITVNRTRGGSLSKILALGNEEGKLSAGFLRTSAPAVHEIEFTL